MIVRLSGKLAKKIGESPTESLPQDPNPFADWSCHLFRADRVQYILITNTPSLYSMVMYGRGVTDHSSFLTYMVSLMREVLHDDGLDAIFSRHVAPTTAEVLFSKALNRSIVGTMNDLVYNAKIMLSDGLTAPYDVGFRLNEMPSPAQGCADPRKAFLAQRSIDRSTEESRQG